MKRVVFTFSLIPGLKICVLVGGARAIAELPALSRSRCPLAL